MKLERNWSNVDFFQRTIVFATQLIVFLLSVGLVAKGSITVGDLVALNGYALMFFGPFAALGRSWQVIQNGVTTAANAEKVFDMKEEVYSSADAVNLEKLSGKVQFKNVGFQLRS